MHYQISRESADKVNLYNLSYEDTLTVGSRSPKSYHIKLFSIPVIINTEYVFNPSIVSWYRLRITGFPQALEKMENAIKNPCMKKSWNLKINEKSRNNRILHEMALWMSIHVSLKFFSLAGQFEQLRSVPYI